MMCRPTKFNFILINEQCTVSRQISYGKIAFLNNNTKNCSNLFLCGETFMQRSAAFYSLLNVPIPRCCHDMIIIKTLLMLLHTFTFAAAVLLLLWKKIMLVEWIARVGNALRCNWLYKYCWHPEESQFSLKFWPPFPKFMNILQILSI